MLLVDVLLRSNIFPFQYSVSRREPILDALFKISESFYFGPHHLIMVFLLYFEEKVHKKKLQRADIIPLLFPRLFCHILEHIGYPIKPHLERRHHCREHFTLYKWTQLAGKNLTESAPEAAPPRLPSPIPAQVEQAQQDERPTKYIPPTPAAPSMPQATSIDPPAISLVPPAAPPISEHFITVSGTKFRAMVQLFRTLTAMHNDLFQQMADIRAHQDQHTAILRQIQQHLGLLPPPQTDIPEPSEPITPAEEVIPAEETTRVDVPVQATHEVAIKPSSPSKSPAP